VGTPVVLLCETLVAQKLRVHPLQRHIAGLLWLRDTVPMVLVGLVVSGVVGGLRHYCNREQR